VFKKRGKVLSGENGAAEKENRGEGMAMPPYDKMFSPGVLVYAIAIPGVRDGRKLMEERGKKVAD